MQKIEKFINNTAILQIEYWGNAMKNNLNLGKTFGRPVMKKISLNMEKENLKMIDELAKITGNTRTELLSSIIYLGIKPQIEIIAKIWRNMKKDKKYSKNIKNINECIKKIEEFKKKWDLKEIKVKKSTK